MACKKYILTNNTSQGLTFSYQECSNNMWEYDILLTPGQIRNIWLVNGTFQAALEEQFTIVEEVFPPISPTPSNTPTNTPTPSNTGTQTPTPTNTGTQTPTPSNTGTQTPTPTPTQTPTQTPTNTSTQTPTQTPTNTSTQTPTNTSTQTPTQTPTNTPTQTQTPTNTQTSTPTPSTTEPARYEFVVEFATEQLDACGGYGPELSIWGIDPIWDHNTFFYDSASGPVTTNMEGWYQYSAQVFNLDSNGIVQGPGYLCPTLTPTPTNTQTPTNTPTNTSTPTNTPTNTSTQTQTPTNTSTTTPTPTPTRNHYDYLLSSGATSNDACSNVAQTVYGSLAGGVGPNLGEVLYQSINPLANPVDEAYWSDGTDWYKTDTSGVIVQIDIDGCI